MASLRFICSPGCDNCCRYSSWLLSEIADVRDVAFGLRLSMHVEDSGSGRRAKKINEDLESRFPSFLSRNGGRFFFEARIVDAGMERSLHGRCPNRKRVSSGEGCGRGKRPAFCRAQPFNPSLPLFLQGEHLFYMKDSMGCSGGVHPRIGKPFFSSGSGPFALFGRPRILDGRRGEAFALIQEEQRELLPVQEILFDLVLHSWGAESMEKLCTGTTRDAMGLTSVGPLVQACVMGGVWEKSLAVSFLKNQMEILNRAEREFGEKYGKKVLFPQKARADGQEGVSGRKRIFKRQAAWKKEYAACLDCYCYNNDRG